MRDIDSYRGCLVSGALRYFVGFMDEQANFKKFGTRGITDYVLHFQGIARFFDDTQMTLYAANSLLVGTTRGATRGVGATRPSYAA